MASILYALQARQLHLAAHHTTHRWASYSLSLPTSPFTDCQERKVQQASKQASKRAGRHDVRNRHDLSIQGPTRSISDADTGCGTQHNTCVMVHMCLFVANSSSLAATEARVRYLLCRALSVHRGRFSAYDGPPEPEPKMEMYLFSCHVFSCRVFSCHLVSRRSFSCQLSS